MLPRCPESTCACLPGGVSNLRTATVCAEARWGYSPVLEDPVAASVRANAQLPQQHLRVRYAGLQSFFRARLERAWLARPRRSRTAHRRAFRFE